jgi:hypothetical protein
VPDDQTAGGLEYCIGQLGLGLPPPLGPQPIRVREAQPLVLLPPHSRLPQPIRVRVREAQPLVLLPLLAAGPRGVSPPYIMYTLLINTSISFFPNSHLLSVLLGRRLVVAPPE